ncbi:MAG: BACON domain-containing protein, partial [Bryobacterales bacterium]|nr:BACON domain-containing protein [Bryobacterales bacterium]
MSPCPPLRLFALILLSAPAFAQNTRLTFRPVAAEWSAALNRIVMVSATPDELHLFDPATQLTQSVPLPAAPLSVSISPNGFYAAVSHAASASYIDLRARTVVSTRPYPAGSGSLPSPYAVLDSNWLYILSPSGYASFPLPQGDGFGRTEYRATGGRLHPAGGFIYGTRDSTSPNDIEQLTLGPGLISAQRDSPYHGEFSFCGNIWYSPDGRRIYNSCGTAVRAPAMDAAEIFFPSRVRWLSEAGTGRIAIIPDAPSTNPNLATSSNVVLLSSSAYTEIGRLAIPTVTVGQRTYLGLGRWIFFNNSGTGLHVVYQAEAAAGISDDFGVQTYELASPAPCTATFPTAVLPVRAEGILQTVPIQAAPDCVRTVTSNAEWAQVVSGAYGAGNGNFTLHVRANYGNQPRSATLSMGTQTMQITQPAAPAAVPRQQVSSYAIVDAAFSKALDRMVLVTSPP